jgi:hypothetical protein
VCLGFDWTVHLPSTERLFAKERNRSRSLVCQWNGLDIRFGKMDMEDVERNREELE